MTFVCRKGRWYAHGRWATLPRGARRSPPPPSHPHPTNRTPLNRCDPLPLPRRTGRSVSGFSDCSKDILILQCTGYCSTIDKLWRSDFFFFFFKQAWKGLEKCKHQNCGRRKKVTKVMILAVAVGVDESGLTGAHMLLLLLKCLFSTYRFDTGEGK